MDALDPNDLRQLFTDAIFGGPNPLWDASKFDAATEVEDGDRDHAALIADVAARYRADELRDLLV